MSKQIINLCRAAKELNLIFHAPYTVRCKDGSDIEAIAYFPQLSGEKGNLVFCSRKTSFKISDKVFNEGYTTTFYHLTDDVDEEYCLDHYQEMFIEWGWSDNSSPEPEWMREVDIKLKTKG